MNAFLSGPMLCIALLVFVAGLAVRVVWYVHGLDWKLERVAYAHAGRLGWLGAIHSALKWLLPFGTHSWRKQIFTTVAFFLFHLGVVVAPLFVAGHMIVMEELVGFSWPSIPAGCADFLAVCGLIGGVMLLLRRLLLEQVRFLSDWKDYSLLGLCIVVLVSAVLARFQMGCFPWTTLHMLCGDLVLILAPFTKLSHIVLYFMSRGQLGMDFAVKRGGQTRGPAFPW